MDGKEYYVSCLRKKGDNVVCLNLPDIAAVSLEQIIKCLPNPEPQKSGYKFSIWALTGFFFEWFFFSVSNLNLYTIFVIKPFVGALFSLVYLLT